MTKICPSCNKRELTSTSSTCWRMFQFAFYGCDKIPTKIILGTKEFIWLTYQRIFLRKFRQELKIGTWRKEMKQRTQRGASYSLDFHDLLSLHFQTIQDLWLGHLTLVINQRNAEQTGQLYGNIFSIEVSSSQVILTCVKLTKKLDSSKDSQENASANIMVNNERLSFLCVRN